jgi:2-oxopent-4-enoate/cis-2-oxohex-4-enoate hydratase
MDDSRIEAYGEELYAALRSSEPVAPLTEREPDLTLEQAYRISRSILSRRLAVGEKLIGKKVGVTSVAVQQMLDVHQPDFGFLTDAMVYPDGGEVLLTGNSILPRAEGEIAFVLKSDVSGPGITNADVLAATDKVYPCFEIVDSRVRDWKIKIQDTVADNASCHSLVLGREGVSPHDVDLVTCGMVIEKNGQLLSTGAGAAALGSPVNCVTWLANTLGSLGIPLVAGDIVLSGSLVPLESVKPGDSMSLRIGGIGSASLSFV